MKRSDHKGLRSSLLAKLIILISVIILLVSAVLLLVSNNSYVESVFFPKERKLNSIQVPEEIADTLGHFLQIIESDGFQEARAKSVPDENGIPADSPLAVWLSGQPTWREEPIYSDDDNLVFEWISVIDDFDLFLYIYDLRSVGIELCGNGKTYRFYRRLDSENTLVFNAMKLLGEEGSYYPDLSAEDYDQAVLTRYRDRDLYLRCVRFPLEGGEGRIWASYDMTDAYDEYDQFLVKSLLSVIGSTLVLMAVLVIILRRQVITPLRGLTKAAQDFLPGEDGTYSADKVSRVKLRTNDEIGVLSRDISSMQTQIVENTGNLARMTAERERIASQMNLARDIQVSALPRKFPPFPERKEFDLFASMTPAMEVGGDFYDFFLIGGNRLALVIADVSGKGIPAALFMMAAKSSIKGHLLSGLDPASALERINLRFCEENDSATFVTVWLAVIELSTGKGLACNAGHEHPAVRRAGGTFELLKYKHRRVVGAIRSSKYENRAFEMHPGDCLFVYTDGVTEAHNAEKKLFGEERLTAALNRNPEAGPEELLTCVREALDGFVKDAPQSDDITMLAFRYYGPSGKPEAPAGSGDGAAGT